MATIDDILERQSRGDSDFWHNTLANIANVVMSIPERRARAQADQADALYRQSRLDLQREELAGKQQERMAQRIVNGIAAKYIKPSDDGSYETVDEAGLAQALAAAGQPPETMLHYSKMIGELKTSYKKASDAKAQTIADTAAGILRSSEKPSSAELAFGLAIAKKNHNISEEQLQPFYDLMDSGQDVRPALINIVSQFDREGKHKDLLKPDDETVIVPPKGVLTKKRTGEVLFENVQSEADESGQSKSVLLDGKPAEVIFLPKTRKFILPTGEDVSARVKPMPPSSVVYPQSRPDRLVKVEHKDPISGKTVIEWLPESSLRGREFEKGAGAGMETRLASAETVKRTGDDIIAMLRDPKVAAQVGPAMGRFNTLRDFIGNPPPELAELAGSLESYALSNMGVHGMRSVQGAQQIKDMLDKKHTPESLIKTIEGLNKFSQHFMETQGRSAPAKDGAKKNPFRP